MQIFYKFIGFVDANVVKKKVVFIEKGWRLIMNSIKVMIFLLVLSGCSPVAQKETSTSFLKPEIGYKGSLIEAEVDEIIYDELYTSINIVIPSYNHDIEFVKVFNEDKRIEKQVKPYKVLKNSDGQSTGLIIYLDKNHNLPFKITYGDIED